MTSDPPTASEPSRQQEEGSPDGAASVVPALDRSRRIAWLLDDLIPIPGTRFRIGLDPLLGLVPGGGDVVGWIFSLHLLWTGWRLRADPATMLRMAGHLLVDTIVGAIPALGDLFDVVWKANDRNLKILETLAVEPARTRRSSMIWLIGIAGGSSMLIGGFVWGMWRLISGVLGLVF